MNEKNILIVFVKNPVLGKVKQRLAEKTGDYNALKIYESLLKKTLEATSGLNVAKTVFYSDFIPENDMWLNAGFQQFLQHGTDIGIRMENAFLQSFENNYQNVVLVGSDIYNLKKGIVFHAFELLKKNNFVIGPAYDGGYYLIGKNKMHPPLFYNKKWSTNSVFKNTIADIQKSGLKYKLLPVLNDIDTFEDLMQFEELTSLISFESANVN
ncbi:MAG: glycosyltransferase [Chlorobi bacterium]|nr:glycosyltransferase [Chlorobiota bacterium]